jgi:hypothetical protein
MEDCVNNKSNLSNHMKQNTQVLNNINYSQPSQHQYNDGNKNINYIQYFGHIFQQQVQPTTNQQHYGTNSHQLQRKIVLSNTNQTQLCV